MKKSRIVLLCLLMAVSLFAVCGTTASSAQDANSLAQFKSDKDPSEWTIAVVVKDMTNSWFSYLNQGVVEFAADTGINAYQTGPTETDAALQIQVIEDLIAQGVDAIAVVPSDPSSLEAVLGEALDQGIVVITHEAVSQENTLFDIESVNNIEYGEFLMEMLAKSMNYEGVYTTMVASLTAESHNLWADAAIAYQKANYPDMILLEAQPKVEHGDNSETAYEKTKELLKTYPEVTGIFACGSPGGPGASRAVEELGLSGKVKVVGQGILSENKDYLESGTLVGYERWAAEHAGYAMCSLAAKILAGETIEAGIDLNVDGFRSIAFAEDSDKVIVGSDMVAVTKENMGEVEY